MAAVNVIYINNVVQEEETAATKLSVLYLYIHTQISASPHSKEVTYFW